MEIKKYEELIKKEVSTVIAKIFNDKPTLPIDVSKGERVGDAISKFLEAEFVKYTRQHQYFRESESSPTGRTKNPWDAQTYFEIKGQRELIWIDFKAVNVDNDNSNPDSGTPNKLFELMFKHNSFYLLYVVVYYQGLGEGLGLKFVKKDEVNVKPIFLKDVEQNMHITPPNQIQFNVFAKEKYRTRDEFIDFFKNKLKESIQRRIDNAVKKLDLIVHGKYSVPKTIFKEQEFDFTILKEMNKEQEDKIRNL